jgi:LysM repeat protein
MINKTVVRCLAALIAIFLAIGLVEYAHLNGAGRHPHLSFAAHTPSTVGVPARPVSPLSNDAVPMAPARAGGYPVPAGPRTKDDNPVTVHPSNPIHRAALVPETAVRLVYVVQPGDTLWHLAATHLGSPTLWTELFALNQGRHEPNGGAFVNPNLIYPGWTIGLPTGATAVHNAGSVNSATPSVASGTSPTQIIALSAPAKDSSQ